MIALALLLGLGLVGVPDEDGPLNVTDLPEYREALFKKPEGRATKVSFRDLWDHPAAFSGRRVTVEGELVRTFHQPATGLFPPLVEGWLRTQAGDLFCVVYPDKHVPRVRGYAGFTGTFLRRVQYVGGDTERVAPLIVGSEPPIAVKRPSRPPFKPPGSPLDWALGGGIALVVVWVLIFQHLRRPVRKSYDMGPAPRFEPDPNETFPESMDG